MRRSVRTALFVLSVLFMVAVFAQLDSENSVSRVSLSVPPGTRLSNLKYGPGATDYVDLQFPESEPVGVVVWLHSGGWIAGTRTTGFAQDIPQWLLRRGWMLASVDYRLTAVSKRGASTNAFPAAVNDTQRATLWVESRLKRFGVPSRIVLAGMSAGGNLALVSAIATADISHVSGVPPRVDGVLSVSGPTDVAAVFLTEIPIFSAAAAMYGGCDTTKVDGDIRNCVDQPGFWERMRRAGVEWNVMHAASGGAWFPPVYVIGGVRDRLVDPTVHIDPIIRLWREVTGDARFAQSDVVLTAGHNLTTAVIDVDGLSAWLISVVRGEFAGPNRGATRQRLREVRL